MKSPSLNAMQIEILDDAVVDVLRRLTPAQRLAAVFDCNRTWRLRLAGHLRTRHPDWSDDQIAAEVARRMARGAS